MIRLWKLSLLLLLLAAVAGPAALVSAQKAALDPTADPNYGTWPLAEYPDPYIMTLDAGGDINARDAEIGADCTGFMTSQPDIVLTWDGGDLRVFFAAAGDTTLVMALPDGSFLCNDDTVGLNPVINVLGAAAGNYAVWFGSFSGGTLVPGHFVATGGQSLPGALVSDLLGSAGGSTTPIDVPVTTGSLDAAATPIVSTVTLEPGFQPDPLEVPIEAGGSENANQMSLDSSCRGFVTSAPVVSIVYTTPGRFLRIFARSLADTTLIVGLPDGTFLCNDDFGGRFDPLVDITGPAAGTYAVWVGTFSTDSLAEATLVLTNTNTLDPANTGP